MKEELEHDDDILQELEGTPLLKGLKGKQMFDAPKGYFDRFQSQMDILLEDDKVLEAAPLIQQAGKKNIFQVPSRYFEELPDKVMARLGSETRVINLWTRTSRFAIGIAAALALVIASIVIFQTGDSDSSDQRALSELLQNLSDTEMLAVVEGADIDEYDLMYALDAADIADMEAEFEEEWEIDFTEPDLSEGWEELELDEEDLEVIMTDLM